jgi:hypothetical protein
MMLAWMVYVVVVSLVLGAAAFAAERAAQMSKAPTRWLWAASLLVSVLLPLAAVSVSIRAPVAGPKVGLSYSEPSRLLPLFQLPASRVRPSTWLATNVEPIAAAPGVDAILIRLWGAASGVILLGILVSGVQLRRRQRGWAVGMMAGVPVHMSDDVGPAVVGLIQPRIVVPRWIGEATPETQALVLAHEQSHLDAGDARLLALAALLIAAAPWNLPLWWQLRRLRFAIEVDCDARVLKGGHDLSRYGETLIMVGERQSRHFAVVAAMSESRSFLEQRIRKMLWKPNKFAWASAMALAGLGFVLAASAAQVSPPAAPETAALMQGGTGGMKHYKNAEWNFAIDLPERWNAFPAQPTNSPNELIRFLSNENGTHALIVFRSPNDPAVSPETTLERVQESLAKGGFSHFVAGKVLIGAREVLTLDCDRTRPDGKLWSVREYFIIDGTLNYTLGFGTTDRGAMFGLFDRMAKSFTFGNVPGFSG